MTGDTPFRILAVCTGNVCRSPLTERLLSRAFNDSAPGQFEVSSAGTGALARHAIDAPVAEMARTLGADADCFSARQLTAGLLDDQDLVLAMTRAHRGIVVDLQPSALRRTFTLRELARLLPEVPGEVGTDGPQRWRSVLPRALRARRTHPVDPAGDDVVDPFRREPAVYELMAQQVVPAVEALAAWERSHR